MLDGLAGARTVAEFAGRERDAYIGDVSSGFPGIPLAAEAQLQKPCDCDRELYKEYRIATSSYLPVGSAGYVLFLEYGKSVSNTQYTVANAVIDYIYTQNLPLVFKTDRQVTFIGSAVQ